MIGFHFFRSLFGVCWLRVNNAGQILLKIFKGLTNTEILKFQTRVGVLDVLVNFKYFENIFCYALECNTVFSSASASPC